MPDYFLRLEAVNFDAFIDDTNDLSTIRGGSLLMMRAAKEVEPACEGDGELSGLVFLARGASTGLGRFAAGCAEEAERIRRAAHDLLRSHPQLQYATFVVDVWPASNDGRSEDLEMLRAKNRWRQHQQPTLTVPPELTKERIELARQQYDSSNPVESLRGQMPERGFECEIDLVRPATILSVRSWSDGKAEWISDSVHQRREYGKAARRQFYQDRTPRMAEGLEFTHDLNQLGARSAPEVSNDDDVLRHLDRKIAVLCLDGNKQSETSAGLAPDELARFRNYVSEKNDEVLSSLLAEIKRAVDENPATCAAGNDWQWTGPDANGDKQTLTRLETLLWGGDDIVWVVPAWQGWAVAQRFFEAVGGENPWTFGKQQLTYSGGLVFCHATAPIQRIKKLAWELVVLGKQRGERDKVHGNWLAYEVLESFDVLGADLLRDRAQRCGAWTDEDSDPLLIDANDLQATGQRIRAAREAALSETDLLSRRTIESLARRIGADRRDATLASDLANAVKTSPALADLSKHTGSRLTGLIHLAMLWDYL